MRKTIRALILTILSTFTVMLPLRSQDLETGKAEVSPEAKSDSALLVSERIVDTNIIIPSLDFKGVTLQDAFTALIRAYKLSFYIDSSVTGNISIRLDNVSLNDAILFIAKEYKLAWERTGDIVKIWKPEIPPPPPEPLNIEYDGANIAFDLKNADLTHFIESVIEITKRNIIIGEDAHGTITGRLTGIEFEKGMKAILNSNGFTFSKIEGIYHIGYMEKADATGGKISRYAVYCQNDSVTVDVRNAPIADILATLSDECRMGIIVHGKIDGSITASYKSKPLSDVLGYILRGTPYSYKKEGDIYFVGDKTSEDLFASKLIRLQHISNISIQDIIPATISKQVSIQLAKEQNGLIVTGPSTSILEVGSFLREIDIPPAQVLFEAIVIDYNLSELSEFNIHADNTGDKRELPDQIYYPDIDYSNTGDNLNVHIDNIADFLDIKNIGHLSSDFFLRIRMMEEEGIANIRSRPQIAALNGHPASIEIGTSQYYLLESQTIYPSDQTSVSTQTSQRFEVVEADMSLEVTPWVTESGEIIVEIKPEFNSPATVFDPDVPPTINRRILKSTVRLRDGETIILGGMIQHYENATIDKFPILGDLPIIGRIFQNRSTSTTKSELMVYLTPHVYYGAEGSINIQEALKEK